MDANRPALDFEDLAANEEDEEERQPIILQSSLARNPPLKLIKELPFPILLALSSKANALEMCKIMRVDKRIENMMLSRRVKPPMEVDFIDTPAIDEATREEKIEFQQKLMNHIFHYFGAYETMILLDIEIGRSEEMAYGLWVNVVHLELRMRNPTFITGDEANALFPKLFSLQKLTIKNLHIGEMYANLLSYLPCDTIEEINCEDDRPTGWGAVFNTKPRLRKVRCSLKVLGGSIRCGNVNELDVKLNAMFNTRALVHMNAATYGFMSESNIQHLTLRIEHPLEVLHGVFRSLLSQSDERYPITLRIIETRPIGIWSGGTRDSIKRILEQTAERVGRTRLQYVIAFQK